MRSSSEFIALLKQYQILQFGQFTLKSGRQSPYFFNAGRFDQGLLIYELGRQYAKTIVDSQLEFDLLFGPAYKGIPLVIATVIALQTDHNRNVPYCFNRKEAKTHGEGGQLVGAPLQGRVLIVDDVMTAGTAIRESMTLIEQHKAQLAGVCVALDRQEKGPAGQSAVQTIQQEYDTQVMSLLSLDDLIDYLATIDDTEVQTQILNYRKQYGV